MTKRIVACRILRTHLETDIEPISVAQQCNKAHAAFEDGSRIQKQCLFPVSGEKFLARVIHSKHFIHAAFCFSGSG
jgi:hypothetical protein